MYSGVYGMQRSVPQGAAARCRAAVRMTRGGVATMTSATKRRGPVPSTGEGPDVLERLVQIMRSNERLFAELQGLAGQINRARAYLAEPGAHAAIGEAHLGRLRTKYS